LLFSFYYIREIALDTIKGKSKNFKKLMNEKLQEIKYDLARNGKQTKEQKLVISKFPLAFEPEAFLLFLALWLLRLPVFLFLECHWLFFQALL
jgi:hypothetical protein